MKFLSASAYRTLFMGCTEILGAHQLWKVQAPGRCRFFSWLVLHGCCWTSNRLHRRGLRDRDECALCAQKVETLDHLLTGCVHSRETWFVYFGLSNYRIWPLGSPVC